MSAFPIEIKFNLFKVMAQMARWLLLPQLLVALCASASASEKSQFVLCEHSGRWSEATTWQDGHIPAQGDSVLIPAGKEVLYDVQSEQAIRLLKIAGALRFATDRDTRLDVGLVRVEAGDDLTEEGVECGVTTAAAA